MMMLMTLCLVGGPIADLCRGHRFDDVPLLPSHIQGFPLVSLVASKGAHRVLRWMLGNTRIDKPTATQALQHACQHCDLSRKDKVLQAMRLLVDRGGADLAAAALGFVRWACAAGNRGQRAIEGARMLLVDVGEGLSAVVEARDEQGLKPMHVAAEAGYLELVRFLFYEALADVNSLAPAVLPRGWAEYMKPQRTPLGMATFNRHWDVVLVLLQDLQADVSICLKVAKEDRLLEEPLLARRWDVARLFRDRGADLENSGTWSDFAILIRVVLPYQCLLLAYLGLAVIVCNWLSTGEMLLHGIETRDLDYLIVLYVFYGLTFDDSVLFPVGSDW